MRKTRYPLLFILTQQPKFDTAHSNPDLEWGVGSIPYTEIHDGGRVHLSPRIHQEYTSRHRRSCRTPAENLTTGKEYIEPSNIQQNKGSRQKKRRVSRTGSASGVGNWSRDRAAWEGKCLRQRWSTETAGEWSSWPVRVWMEWGSHNPCHRCTYTRQGCKSPRKCFRLEMEHRDWIDWREMVWRNLREESAVGNAYEAKPANLEAGWYCWVTHWGCSHLYSLSLCTYQHQTAETTQGGWPVKDLKCKVTQKDSSQGDL